MDTIQFLNRFYHDTDLVCLFFNPVFEKTRQRFVYATQLKTEKWQRFLKLVNSRGCNVYLSVYPFQARQRTEENVVDQVNRIYLDFDSEQPYRDFRKDYIPVCVIQTSPGKFQCFLKLAKPKAKELVKAAARGLAARYGADHTFDLSRVLRLPGFRNVKYPAKPLARVIEVNLEEVYSIGQLPVFVEESEPSFPCNTEVSWHKKQPWYGYEHFLASAPRKVNGDPDFSSADLSYCMYLFSRGFDEGETRSALVTVSPNLRQRKGGGLDNYLNKTLSRAHSFQKIYNNRLSA